MKSQKLTNTQKLDYLIKELEEVNGDVKEIKREVKSHTQLLQDITANAVTLSEHQSLEARVTSLEQS